MLHVHFEYPFCIPMLHVHAMYLCACSCPSCLSIIQVHLACPFFMSGCSTLISPCCISMLLVHATYPCFLSLLHVHTLLMSRCMLVLRVRVSTLHVLASGTYCMYMLHEYVAGTRTWTWRLLFIYIIIQQCSKNSFF
jgi:hypothetical protein